MTDWVPIIPPWSSFLVCFDRIATNSGARNELPIASKSDAKTKSGRPVDTPIKKKLMHESTTPKIRSFISWKDLYQFSHRKSLHDPSPTTPNITNRSDIRSGVSFKHIICEGLETKNENREGKHRNKVRNQQQANERLEQCFKRCRKSNKSAPSFISRFISMERFFCTNQIMRHATKEIRPAK